MSKLPGRTGDNLLSANLKRESEQSFTHHTAVPERHASTGAECHERHAETARFLRSQIIGMPHNYRKKEYHT